MKGIDYSDSRPGGAAIAAAGYQFVMRYIPYGGFSKGLTIAEAADLHANGLAIGLVFESTGVDPLDGWSSGVYDAQLAVTGLADLIAPPDLPVYFGVDFGASADQFTAIDAYLQGAASVLGDARVGVYGSYALIEHCARAKTSAWFWQTYAWSGGAISNFNHVYQYFNGQVLNGGSIDYDEATSFSGMWESEMNQALIDLWVGRDECNGDLSQQLILAQYRSSQWKGDSIMSTALSAIQLAAQASGVNTAAIDSEFAKLIAATKLVPGGN